MFTIYNEDCFRYADNKVWSWKFMTNAIFINSPIPVETFFFLSGLLVTYFYIKDKMDKDRNQLFTYRAKINEFFVLVIKRYIRYVFYYIDNKKDPNKYDKVVLR